MVSTERQQTARSAEEVPYSPSASSSSHLERYLDLPGPSRDACGAHVQAGLGDDSDSEAEDGFDKSLFYLHPGSKVADAPHTTHTTQWKGHRRQPSVTSAIDGEQEVPVSGGMQIDLSFDGRSSQAGETDADDESAGGTDPLAALGLGDPIR